jgi:cysteinyl-tRNA synthetase
MRSWIVEVLGLQVDAANGAAGVSSQKALDAAMAIVLDARRKAREQKDWATSDAIRDQLAAGGIQVKDGEDGSTYRVQE